jgi:hypothetical protein
MTIYVPPYYYAYGGGNIVHSGSGTSLSDTSHSESSRFGVISTVNWNRILDPGDSGSESTSTYSAMQILIQAPGTGRLNILATLRCLGLSTYWGRMDDELGWTNANAIQSSRFVMGLNTPPGYDAAYHQLLYYHRGDNEGQWSGNIAEPGEFRDYRFVSRDSYQAGQSLILTAHIEDSQDVWVNDMDYMGEIRDAWEIIMIDVTAIP